MKFFTVLAGAVAIIGNVHAQSTGTPVTSAAAPTSSVESAFLKCLEACDPADTSCRAQCASVPFPNQSQVNATVKCVADCPQGNGTAADIKAYVECRDGCINDNYLTTDSPSSPTSGSKTTGTDSQQTGDADSDSDSGDSDNGSSDGGSGGDDDSAASALAMGSSFGLVAVLVAVFAL